MIKKIFILLAFTILLSGCNIEYNIKFDENFRVEDKFILTSKYDEFEENKPEYWGKFFGTRLSDSKFINPLFEEYSDYIQTSEKKYKDYNLYFDDEYLKMYVKNISLNENDDYKFKVVFNDKFMNDVYSSENLEELRINVEFPYKVLSSNATTNNDNIYTWIINKENEINEIYIEYRNPKILSTTNNITFKLIILTGIVLVIVFIYDIYKKNKKINDLRY